MNMNEETQTKPEYLPLKPNMNLVLLLLLLKILKRKLIIFLRNQDRKVY